MTDIVVVRDAGDKRGDDIIDPLISADFVAVSRGRAELDRHASEKAEIQYETIYRSSVRLGQLVEISDALQGLVYRAKVVGLQHQISPTGAVTRLTVEREVDF